MKVELNPEQMEAIKAMLDRVVEVGDLSPGYLGSPDFLPLIMVSKYANLHVEEIL